MRGRWHANARRCVRWPSSCVEATHRVEREFFEQDSGWSSERRGITGPPLVNGGATILYAPGGGQSRTDDRLRLRQDSREFLDRTMKNRWCPFEPIEFDQFARSDILTIRTAYSTLCIDRVQVLDQGTPCCLAIVSLCMRHSSNRLQQRI